MTDNSRYLKASKNPKYTVSQINAYPTTTNAVQVVTTLIYACKILNFKSIQTSIFNKCQGPLILSSTDDAGHPFSSVLYVTNLRNLQKKGKHADEPDNEYHLLRLPSYLEYSHRLEMGLLYPLRGGVWIKWSSHGVSPLFTRKRKEKKKKKKKKKETNSETAGPTRSALTTTKNEPWLLAV